MSQSLRHISTTLLFVVALSLQFIVLQHQASHFVLNAETQECHLCVSPSQPFDDVALSNTASLFPPVHFFELTDHLRKSQSPLSRLTPHFARGPPLYA